MTVVVGGRALCPVGVVVIRRLLVGTKKGGNRNQRLSRLDIGECRRRD